MQLQENTLFANRYELIKLLGRGGFSEVWLAKDNWTHLRIALKVYAPGQGMDANGLQEFCGELASVYDLNHSNLLKPQHVDTWENMPYLIMAYCPEGSCAGKVGQMSEDAMWKFIHDVASGLAYLHSKDVVHQDIKPDNLLIDDSGNYLITDFGVSTRARSTLRKSVVSSTAGGTTAYMGPERFSRQPAPTKASDIWSFGAMCFELLEGEVPFGEIGGGMQKGGAEIPAINANVSDALKFTITKMLQKETWNRPTAETLVGWAKKPSSIVVDKKLFEDAPVNDVPQTPVNASKETQRLGTSSGVGQETQRLDNVSMPHEATTSRIDLSTTEDVTTNQEQVCDSRNEDAGKNIKWLPLACLFLLLPALFVGVYYVMACHLLWFISGGYGIGLVSTIFALSPLFPMFLLLIVNSAPTRKRVLCLNISLPIIGIASSLYMVYAGTYFTNPILPYMCAMLNLLSCVFWFVCRRKLHVSEKYYNPVDLRSKVIFGLICVVVLLITIFRCNYFYNLNLSYLQSDQPIDSSVAIDTKPSITVKEQGEQFLQTNAKKTNIHVTSSGLQYQIIKKNVGTKPTINDRVKVHYHGTLIDGTTFDSSIDRGEPIVFALNQVIMGWQEGLQLMSVGSKYKFFIPYELGYGDRDLSAQGLPPYSCLIYEVELLDIIPGETSSSKKKVDNNPKSSAQVSRTEDVRTELYIYPRFKSTEYDFGKISENGGIVSTTFYVVNEGMDDLVISDVKASCSCISSDWTKGPIPAASTGEIHIKYDPMAAPEDFKNV